MTTCDDHCDNHDDEEGAPTKMLLIGDAEDSASFQHESMNEVDDSMSFPTKQIWLAVSYVSLFLLVGGLLCASVVAPGGASRNWFLRIVRMQRLGFCEIFP
jgi:hypothetical protein